MVNCPKCGTAYKLRADFMGNLKCKKCKRAFNVGQTASERQGQRSRDRDDQKTAVKLVVICSVALLGIAGIIAAAGGVGSGTSVQDGSRQRSRGREASHGVARRS